MSMRRGRKVIAVLAAALVLGATAVLVEETPAAAAVPTSAPTGLAPNGGSASGNPQLSWDALDGAARYRVQISESESFGSTLVNEVTYNTTYTPTNELPTAPSTLYWRVAGMDTSGSALGPWANAQVTKTLERPELQSPGEGAPLDYRPADPTFSWTPTPPTKSYVLEIADAAAFV